ncbi:hypothetical protein, partial [Mycobacterium tuberculosis]
MTQCASRRKSTPNRAILGAFASA